MTFETLIIRTLVGLDVPLQDARAIVGEMKADPDNASMAGRWSHHSEDYPDSVLMELCRDAVARAGCWKGIELE